MLSDRESPRTSVVNACVALSRKQEGLDLINPKCQTLLPFDAAHRRREMAFPSAAFNIGP